MAATKFSAALRNQTLSSPKLCRACNIAKSVDQFYKTASGLPIPYCKPCHNRRVTERNRRNAQQTRARRVRWTQKMFHELQDALERTCSKCELTKPVAAFSVPTPTSITLACLDCQSAGARQRLKNDTAHRARVHAWQKRKRDSRSEAQKSQDSTYHKQWRVKNADHKRQRDKAYRKAHPDRVKAYGRKYVTRIQEEITPSYVRALICKGQSPIKTEHLPEPFVDAVRQVILIKRHLRKQNKQQT